MHTGYICKTNTIPSLSGPTMVSSGLGKKLCVASRLCTDVTLRGDFIEPALPNADVIAFVRNVGSTSDEAAHVPNVFWVGQDQVCFSALFSIPSILPCTSIAQTLYQKICIDQVSSGYRWQNAVSIAPVGSTGEHVGSWTATYFSGETSILLVTALRISS